MPLTAYLYLPYYLRAQDGAMVIIGSYKQFWFKASTIRVDHLILLGLVLELRTELALLRRLKPHSFAGW